MERIPTEVWEIIFAYLGEPEDLQNAALTCKGWASVLYSKRHLWLLEQTLPHFVKHLFKKDILTCRQVCKLWCRGVDNFFEKHPYHRHRPGQLNQCSRLSIKDDKDIEEFRSVIFSCSYCSPDWTRKMIQTASNHSRNPIVGRCVNLIYYKSVFNHRDDYTQFLEAFGHHIWFLNLRFSVSERDPTKLIDEVLEVISYVPNLKKLFLSVGRRGNINKHTKLSDYPSWQITESQKERLPKMLETLVLRMDVEIIGEVIMKLLANEKLTRLHVQKMPLVKNVELAPNLLDLRLDARHPVDWKPFLQLTCPLEQIFIHMNQTSDIEAVFELINHFKKTLASLKLEFHYARTYVRSAANLNVFANPEILKECKGLKMVSVCLPIYMSTNFLCGLSGSLECLEFSLSNDHNVLNREQMEEQGLVATEKLLGCCHYLLGFRDYSHSRVIRRDDYEKDKEGFEMNEIRRRSKIW